MKVTITENQYKRIISEYYDGDKLYERSAIIDRLLKGPKEIRKYIDLLPKIECQDSMGNKSICTKIPEVVYVYLMGNY